MQGRAKSIVFLSCVIKGKVSPLTVKVKCAVLDCHLCSGCYKVAYFEDKNYGGHSDQCPLPHASSPDRLRCEERINPEIYFSGDDLDQYRDGDIQRLSEILHQHQLEITFHAPFMDLSPGGIDRRVKEVTLDRFSKVVELAHFFKPKAIVFTRLWKMEIRWKREDVARQQSPDLGSIGWVAEKRGQVLAIENVFEETPILFCCS